MDEEKKDRKRRRKKEKVGEMEVKRSVGGEERNQEEKRWNGRG